MIGVTKSLEPLKIKIGLKIRARMAGDISFVLITIASMIAMAESRVIPAEPGKHWELMFFFTNLEHLLKILKITFYIVILS